MTTLEKIQQANPSLTIHSVFDDTFALYGQVITLPHQDELNQNLTALTTIPATQNQYVLMPQPC